MARVQVINEVTADTDVKPDSGPYGFSGAGSFYDDGDMQHGYRFIWKRP